MSPVDLRPNSYNPNLHDARSFDLLLDSLRRFGLVAPLVALPDGRIIDGEHRWRAALALGIEQVPVCFIKVPEAEVKLLTVLCNRARGAEDKEMLESIKMDLPEGALKDERWDTLKGRR